LVRLNTVKAGTNRLKEELGYDDKGGNLPWCPRKLVKTKCDSPCGGKRTDKEKRKPPPRALQRNLRGGGERGEQENIS